MTLPLGESLSGTFPDSGLRWIALRINVLPKMNTASTRAHLFTQNSEARMWRERVVAVLGRRAPKKPFARARLTMIRFSTRQPDSDNLVASFKQVKDSLLRTTMGPKEKILIRAGIIYDDREPYLEEPPTIVWEKCKKGEEMIEVYVEELPEPEGFVHAPLLIIGPTSKRELIQMKAAWSR